MNESFVRNRLLLHQGQLYQPSKIEAARRDLAALGVFAAVSVHAGTAVGPDGSIPLTFDFQERDKHAVAVTGAFSTDLGGSLRTTWSDRNLWYAPFPMPAAEPSADRVQVRLADPPRSRS